jgi:hypothetical protein
MRHAYTAKIIILSSCMLALTACGKGEVKTGSLTHRFTMVDSEGRNFGIVELDPVSGGTIKDVQGRLVGRVVTPEPTAVAAVAPATVQ